MKRYIAEVRFIGSAGSVVTCLHSTTYGTIEEAAESVKDEMNRGLHVHVGFRIIELEEIGNV